MDPIDQIFRRLGMATHSTLAQNTFGQPIDGRASNTFSTPVGAGSVVPTRFRRLMQDDPQAVDRQGWFIQFLRGTGSPVLGTLARLGITKPQSKPVGLGETIAHTLGGVLGWTALLALPLIGKGISAAGAAGAAGLAKLGMKSAAASAVGRAGATGAVFGAHRAWVDREPLGPEMLKSAATSAVLIGGGGYAIGQLARKLGKMQPTSTSLLEQGIKGHPILSIYDQKTMLQALNQVPPDKLKGAVTQVVGQLRQRSQDLPSAVRSGDLGVFHGAKFDSLPVARQARILLRAFREAPDSDSLLQPVLNVANASRAVGSILSSKSGLRDRTVKSVIKAAEAAKIDLTSKSIGVLSKTQRSQVTKLLEAGTMGEQYSAFQRLRKLIGDSRSSTLKRYNVQSFEELTRVASKKTVNAYVTRNAMMQDITWQLGAQLSKVVSHKVDLPSTAAIQDPKLSRAILNTLQKDISQGRNISRMDQWHPDIIKFLQKWADKTGKSYTSSTFMPDDMKREFDSLLTNLTRKGRQARVLHYDMTTIPLPADIAKKNIPKFILDQKALPKGSIYTPGNLQEALMLRTEVTPFWGRLFSPIRYDLGDSFTSAARDRTNQHRVLVDQYAHKIETWFKTLKVKPGKAATESGVRIGKVLEGSVPENLHTQVRSGAERLLKYKTAPRGAALTRLASDLGIPKKSISDIHKVIRGVASDPNKAKELERLLKLTGADKADYFSQHILAHRLYRAGTLTGKEATHAAKELGLRNASELKVTYQMRRELDNLFKHAGLDLELYTIGYLPHFRVNDNNSYDMILKSFQNLGVSPKEIPGYMWVNQLAPTGTSYQYEQDAFRAFSRYVSGLSKQRHFDDLFTTWNKAFKEMKVSSSRLEVFEDVKAWMLGRPGTVELQMDKMINRLTNTLSKSKWDPAWGPRPTAEISSMLAELQYMGGLGFNPFTAIKNLTQKGLALSSVTDDGNPLHGLKWLMKARAEKTKPLGQYALSHNKILDNRLFLEGLETQHGAIVGWLRRMGVPDQWTGAAKKMQDKMFHMFRRSDISNVEDVWLAKYLYLTEAKKAPLADAINLATQTTMATQFMYGFDSPMMYKSPIGRQLGIFMSWPINWAHMLYNQGTTGDMHRAVATVGMFAIGSEILSLTGFNFRSIHPANTARGMWPLAMLEGEDKWPLSLKTAAAVTQHIRALASGEPEAIDSAFDTLKKRLGPLVPANIVTNRVLNFVDIAKNDWRKYDQRDRLRYETGAGEAIRSLVGPTVEAAQRIDDWQQVSRMDASYRRTRQMAIQSFLDHDYAKFERLQEQLVVNFGKWVEPSDIQQELELRGMDARERQLTSLPRQLRESYLQRYK